MGLFWNKKPARDLTNEEELAIKDSILKDKIKTKRDGINAEIAMEIHELTNKPAKECKNIYNQFEKEVDELIYKQIKEQ